MRRASDKKAEEGKEENKEERSQAEKELEGLQVSILSRADLSLHYTKEEYKKKLDKLQKKMEKLHGELYRKRIPVVLGFEGWDAGGKGGAIKRLTEKMDARGYVVNPTASPTISRRLTTICGCSGGYAKGRTCGESLTGHGTDV